MTSADRETILSALLTGSLLVDDLVAMEKAGLATGFKPGIPKKYQREINRALKLIDETKPQ